MNFLDKIILFQDIVNVFIINLSQLEPHLPIITTYLSDKEKIRVTEFLFGHLKDYYIASHGCKWR